MIERLFWSCSDDGGGTTNPPEENTLTCVITAPLDSSGFFAGDSIYVAANADDTDGSVIEVRFLLDDNGISNDKDFPYSAKIPTNLVAVGSHTITAIAENDKGKEVSSSIFFGIKPNTPTNLTITELNVYTFSLAWADNSTGEDGFKIERKIDDGEYSEIGITTANTYIDSTVMKKGFGSVYYQVRAFKEIYHSDYVLNNATVGFPAPSSLTSTKENLSTLRLNWNDNSSGEDGFKIDKKVGVNDWVVGFATVGENIKTWSDSNAEINELLQYRLYAYKGTNTSSSAQNSIDNSIPVPADFTIVKPSITEATLSWTDNSIGEEKFVIERKLSAETDYVKIAEVWGSDTATKSWYDTTVPNLNYSYRIKATYGSFSSAYAVKSLDNTFPAPTNLSVSQQNIYTFSLTWTDNSTGEDGFKIERKIDDGEYTEIGMTTANTFIDSTVMKKGYGIVYYQIRAFKNSFFSTYVSNNSSVDFPAPVNLTYTKENIYTIKLDWIDNSNGEDGFKIDKKVGVNDWVLNYASVGSNVKTFTDSNAEINETISYRIYAFKGVNISSSIETSFSNTFPAPTNINISQSALTSATFTWSDNSIGEEKFEIERKLSTETIYIKISEVLGDNNNLKTWIDTTTVPNSIYDYRIKAVKNTNSSIYLSTTLNNTIPTPTNLQISAFNENYLKLDWDLYPFIVDSIIIDKKTATDDWQLNYASLVTTYNTWVDSFVTANVLNSYRIRIKIMTYYSNYSNEVSKEILSFWYNTYGPSGRTSVSRALCLADDNCYVFTGYQEDAYNLNNLLIVKADQEGNMLWSHSYNTGVVGYAIKRTDDDGFIIAGVENVATFNGCNGSHS